MYESKYTLKGTSFDVILPQTLYSMWMQLLVFCEIALKILSGIINLLENISNLTNASDCYGSSDIITRWLANSRHLIQKGLTP